MQRRALNIDHETRRSALILGGSALLISSAAIALPMLRKAPRDAHTGCLAGPIARKTIILVDRTDPWSPSTATLLAAQLRMIAQDAAPEERLVLQSFGGSASSLPEPVFDHCKVPATGNVLLETPQRLAREHAAQFAVPLVKALESISKPASAKRTELAQMLALLAAKSRLDAPAAVTSLHIFSDMEENSAAFSFTRKPAQHLDVFAAHFSTVIGERFKDITLHVHLLPPAGNPPPRPDPRIEKAWRAAFARHAITFTWEKL